MPDVLTAYAATVEQIPIPVAVVDRGLRFRASSAVWRERFAHDKPAQSLFDAPLFARNGTEQAPLDLTPLVERIAGDALDTAQKQDGIHTVPGNPIEYVYAAAPIFADGFRGPVGAYVMVWPIDLQSDLGAAAETVQPQSPRYYPQHQHARPNTSKPYRAPQPQPQPLVHLDEQPIADALPLESSADLRLDVPYQPSRNGHATRRT